MKLLVHHVILALTKSPCLKLHPFRSQLYSNSKFRGGFTSASVVCHVIKASPSPGHGNIDGNIDFWSWLLDVSAFLNFMKISDFPKIKCWLSSFSSWHSISLSHVSFDRRNPQKSRMYHPGRRTVHTFQTPSPSFRQISSIFSITWIHINNHQTSSQNSRRS